MRTIEKADKCKEQERTNASTNCDDETTKDGLLFETEKKKIWPLLGLAE
jgi:hypothetical protein